MRKKRIIPKEEKIEVGNLSDLSELYAELRSVLKKQYRDEAKTGYHSYHKEIEVIRDKIRKFKAEEFAAYQSEKSSAPA